MHIPRIKFFRLHTRIGSTLLYLWLVAFARGVFDPQTDLLLRGTVVTMDDNRNVITNGSVLVRAQMVAAVWSGDAPPAGIFTTGATVIDLGADAYIFPGLINLHCHPFYSVLPLWPLPAPTTNLLKVQKLVSFSTALKNP